MRFFNLIRIATLAGTLAIACTVALAEDLVVPPGDITDTRAFDSPEATILDDVVIKSTANVSVISTFEIILKPGTRIEQGAVFKATMRDTDGLPNRWEMQYFGSLDQNANADFDGDGLTNLQEYLNGTDPAVASADHDNDGLLDTWEVAYGGMTFLTGRNADDDSDGISNWIEYKLGTHPLEADGTGPGIYYQYDKLGRIRKIERIPGQ